MSRLGLLTRTALALSVALFLLGACGGDSGNGDSQPADAAAGECGGSGGTMLSVESADFQFEPAELSAPAGEQVTVEFTNSDDAPHTFTVDELDCDTGTVDPGQSAELSFTMPAEDTGWLCTLHPDMVGMLRPK